VSKPKLYLIPNTLGDFESPEKDMGHRISSAIEELDHFAVENLKVSRRYFVRWGLKHKIDSSQFIIHSKKNAADSLVELESIFKNGHSIGMISDAGCPGIADPGNQLVQLAHRLQIPVIPLVGPSSVFLALMASGMNGQNFSFHGYLPIEAQDRIKEIKALEQKSIKNHSTEIFMETPYRNQGLLTDLIKQLSSEIKLCIASQLTTNEELVISQKIKDWKTAKQLPDLKKKPTIFLIQA